MANSYAILIDNTSSGRLNLNSNDYFDLIRIDGITDYKKTNYLSPLSNSPGSIWSGSHIEPRDIRIIGKMKQIPVIDGSNEVGIEYSLNQLIAFLTKKEDIIFEKNVRWGNTDHLYTIHGNIESISSDRYDSDVQCEININCPYPYFLAQRLGITLNYSSQLEKFRGTTSNESITEVGCIITVVITGSVSGLTIENETTGKIMSLNAITYTEDQSGTNTIVIDTRRGKESVINQTTGEDITSIIDFSQDYITLAVGRNYVNLSYLPLDGQVSSVKLAYYSEHI